MRLLRTLLALCCFAAAALADKADADGCKWSWRALGCVPKPGCKLHFKPRLGTLGPCVKAPPKEAAPAAEAEPAAAAEAPAEAESPAEPAAAEAAPAEAAPAAEGGAKEEP